MTPVQVGDVVRVHFTVRLENGVVIGTSAGGEPVEVTAGAAESGIGIGEAVVGMTTGEKKTVTVAPEQAYGPREPERERWVPRQALPPDVKVGDRLIAQQGAEQTPVWVRQLDDDLALIDENHPLAGQALVFDIELISATPG
jgi:peptidylprolyl isomerase